MHLCISEKMRIDRRLLRGGTPKETRCILVTSEDLEPADSGQIGFSLALNAPKVRELVSLRS